MENITKWLDVEKWTNRIHGLIMKQKELELKEIGVVFTKEDLTSLYYLLYSLNNAINESTSLKECKYRKKCGFYRAFGYCIRQIGEECKDYKGGK